MCCQLVLFVYGMHCQSCVRKIQTHFNEIEDRYFDKCTAILDSKQVRFDRQILLKQTDLSPIGDKILGRCKLEKTFEILLSTLDLGSMFHDFDMLGFKLTNEDLELKNGMKNIFNI